LDLLETIPGGYAVCEEGVSAGVFAELPEKYSGLPLKDHSGKTILPGLVDLHIHAPQYAFRGSGMDMELLDWLNARVFPEEARYAELDYAERAYKAFVKDILAGKLSASGVICGYNYHFGAGACGTADTLTALCRESSVECRVVPAFLWAGSPVSATRIRKALLAGDTKNANAMLGRAFGYGFPVLHGDERGRLLGYPTANQSFPAGFLVPRRGVYSSRVTLHGTQYFAMTNIGMRPTFNGGQILSETHIFGFSGDLYGQRLPVELLRFIRDERTFSGAGELAAQLAADAKECVR
jgi:riboflavin kinase/FMN adenylyltransferase